MNKEQNEAREHVAGPCMVVAPPGSGKTYTMVQRVVFLVCEQQIREDSICVLTFTKASALEMEKRFVNSMNGRCTNVIFGTFHSLFLKILLQETGYTYASIMSEQQKAQLWKTVLRNYGYEDTIYGELIGNLSSELSRLKNRQLPLEGIYEAFEKEKREKCLLDYDDILLECYALFLKYPMILEKYQNKMQYFLVDEFQDCNEIQYKLIRLLAKPDEYLFVVGDDDQSIYGFRGATPSIMESFGKDYPNAKIIYLHKNYRSTQSVVEQAQLLIKQNTMRISKEYTGNKGDGKPVQYLMFKSQQEQLLFIMDLIEKYGKQKQFAIIMRTSSMMDLYGMSLEQRKIPFMGKVKKQSIYEHFICKDICAYLRLSLGEEKAKDLRNILNKPIRHLSQSGFMDLGNIFSQLEQYYEWNKTLLKEVNMLRKHLKRLSYLEPYVAVHYIRKVIGYEQYIDSLGDELGKQKCMLILNQLQREAGAYDSVGDWLENIQREKDGSNIQDDKISAYKPVELLTMHGSKGLEFECVIIPDIIEGNIPHHKANSSEEIEEERRLLYVAMTRAKEELYCMSIHENGDEPHISPSPFLEGIVFH